MKKLENWTMKEIFVSILENKFGLEVDERDRSKYRAYRLDNNCKVFLGKSGAFRVGKSATHSYSVNAVENIRKNKDIDVYEKVNRLSTLLQHKLDKYFAAAAE